MREIGLCEGDPPCFPFSSNPIPFTSLSLIWMAFLTLKACLDAYKCKNQEETQTMIKEGKLVKLESLRLFLLCLPLGVFVNRF